jgi:hypothetical protein
MHRRRPGRPLLESIASSLDLPRHLWDLACSLRSLPIIRHLPRQSLIINPLYSNHVPSQVCPSLKTEPALTSHHCRLSNPSNPWDPLPITSSVHILNFYRDSQSFFVELEFDLVRLTLEEFLLHNAPMAPETDSTNTPPSSECAVDIIFFLTQRFTKLLGVKGNCTLQSPTV